MSFSKDYKDKVGKSIKVGDYVLVALTKGCLAVGIIHKETNNYIMVSRSTYMWQYSVWDPNSKTIVNKGKPKLRHNTVNLVKVHFSNGDYRIEDCLIISKELYDELAAR